MKEHDVGAMLQGTNLFDIRVIRNAVPLQDIMAPKVSKHIWLSDCPRASTVGVP